MCTRALIPLRRLLDDVTKWFLTPNQTPDLVTLDTNIKTSQLQSTICGDNAACLAIAADPVSPTGPRTHHLSIKWHHFRDQIQSGAIKVEKVETTFNWADIFTKPLGIEKFRFLRKLLLGW